MLKIEFDRETDGRWIAEVPALPGVMAYGAAQDEARSKTRLWLCASLPTRSSMASRCRPRPAVFSSMRERLAVHPS
jgi:predicted RNase H-like HicB family nuclease